MRAGLAILLFLSLSPGPAVAQELSYDSIPASTSNALDVPAQPRFAMEFKGDIKTVSSDEAVFRNSLRLSGPLVYPFKAKSVLQFPGRVLQLINPFAGTATSGQTVRMDSRAWATVVGWNPGQSAFADDTHHEPQLRLISINAGKAR